MHAACNQANSPGERGLAAECPPAELDRNTKQRHLTMMLRWVGARMVVGGEVRRCHIHLDDAQCVPLTLH